MKIERIKFYDYYLNEGGNVTINGISSDKISIEDMEESDFDTFKESIFEFLSALNVKYFKSKSDYIWRNLEKNFKSGAIFAGSSKYFVLKKHHEFSRVKKDMGDLDIQFPKEKYKDLVDVLSKNLHSKIAGFEIVGIKSAGTQINVIVKAPSKFKKFANLFQVDFEVVDFEDESPSKFSVFGRNSSWEDLTQNIKGVFKNYLFGALLKRVQVDRDAVLLDKKGQEVPLTNLSNLVFSVDKGMRFRYELVKDANNKPLLTKGKPTYKETKIEDSNYEKNLERIFELAFAKDSSNSEIEKMHSFVGLLELIKKNFSKEDVELTMNSFVNLLWGDKSKTLDKDHKKDIELKMAPYNLLIQKFPYLKKSPGELEKIIATYYREN